MKYTLAELAGMLDHSLLHPTMTDADLETGCAIAAKYHVASVCIKPYWVERTRELLAGTGVAVGTVIGFPHGGNTTQVKRYETEAACREGATEIDMVVNIGKVLSGDWNYVEEDVRAVVEEAHRHNAIVKVIFETDYVTNDVDKVHLCEICERVGADYVKTSTGYGFVNGADGKYSYQGATEHDLKLMRDSCSPNVKLKAAGGVRDLDTLIRCRDLGVDRVGATATAVMLDEYVRRAHLSQNEVSETAAEALLGTGGY